MSFFAAWLTTHGRRGSRSTEKQARFAWQVVQKQSSQVDNILHASVDAGAKPWRPRWLKKPVTRTMSIRALASKPHTIAVVQSPIVQKVCESEIVQAKTLLKLVAGGCRVSFP